MKYIIILFTTLTLAGSNKSFSQLYYPPDDGDWVTTDPSDLGYRSDQIDELVDFLDERNTKSFIILKGGKIAIEKYFDTFTQDSLWYWASAGKSLMATLVGIAQEQNLISLQEPTNTYLGNGWTTLIQAQEDEIKVIHQLTMTTGLDWDVVDVNCLDPECLQYRTEPNTEWFYYNAPYRLLSSVIEEASQTTINSYSRNNLFTKIGMQGIWVNYVLYGKARDMARFGLLMLGNGDWNGETIIGDKDYLSDMISSQNLNPAYGYLWWLNGKDTFVQPGLTVSFNGKLIPSAPDDLYAAMGKNDQKIYVVPSLDMVVIRQGENAVPEATLAVSGFDDELWEYIMALESNILLSADKPKASFFPNPAEDIITFSSPIESVDVIDLQGRLVIKLPVVDQKTSTAALASGIYILQYQHNATIAREVFKKR